MGELRVGQSSVRLLSGMVVITWRCVVAINVYIGKENLPKEKVLVFDVEAAILAVRVIGSAFQRKVLAELEQGEYKDGRVFIDRFGNHLYYTEMSAGSKALFELEGLPDKVVNGAEMGFNALRFVAEIPECSIYFAQRDEALPFHGTKTELYLNGKLYKDCSLLNQKIESGGLE